MVGARVWETKPSKQTQYHEPVSGYALLEVACGHDHCKEVPQCLQKPTSRGGMVLNHWHARNWSLHIPMAIARESWRAHGCILGGPLILCIATVTSHGVGTLERELCPEQAKRTFLLGLHGPEAHIYCVFTIKKDGTKRATLGIDTCRRNCGASTNPAVVQVNDHSFFGDQANLRSPHHHTQPCTNLLVVSS